MYDRSVSHQSQYLTQIMQIMQHFLTTTHYTKAWLVRDDSSCCSGWCFVATWLRSSPPCTLNVNYVSYTFLITKNLIVHEDIVVVVSIATILAGGLEQDVTLQTFVSGMQLIASSHGG